MSNSACRLGSDGRSVRAKSSVPSGDLVLAHLPPYLEKMWLIVGIPYMAGILRDECDVRTRIPNVFQESLLLPSEMTDAALENLLFTPMSPEDARARLHDRLQGHQHVVEQILDILTSGDESVFGFSVFFTNAEFTMEVARRLKERRPSSLVMLGGPEAIQAPEQFHVPWIDAVVSINAETVIVPLTKSLLAGRPGRARNLPGVWINPAHHGGESSAAAEDSFDVPCAVPSRALMDYSEIGPLLLKDPDPFFPVLLNVGCRNNCAFCANRSVYPDFIKGSTTTSIAEITQVLDIVERADAMSRTNIMFCDSTVNEFPQQLEEVCQAVIDRPEEFRTSLLGNMVFGSRLRESTINKMFAAGFHLFYFGLESASAAVRRSMHKPEKIGDIANAMELVHQLLPGSISVSVIVGWPTETEEDFADTLSFLKRAATRGMLDRIIVHIPVLMRGMNDSRVFGPNRGEKYGVFWETDTPGGHPDVRRERLLRFYGELRTLTTVEVPFWVNARLKEWAHTGRR